MTDEQDVLGRDASPRVLPPWLKPVAVLLAVAAAGVWFVVTKQDAPAKPAPAASPSIGPIGGEVNRTCGPANADALAWGSPSGAVEPDSRLVTWRIHLCNRGGAPVTIEGLGPLSVAERHLPASLVTTLSRDGFGVNDGAFEPVPIRIPAGGQVDVETRSVVLGCHRPELRFGLRATVRLGESTKRVDMPVLLSSVSPVGQWCNERRRGDVPPALPLLRDGVGSVVVRGRDIAVEVPLFNPNGLPVTLTGLHSPSPGVRVAAASATTLPPGGRATASVRLAVESCSEVYLDAPWQLTFKGALDGTATQIAPVRLAANNWQAAPLKAICPAARGLVTGGSPPDFRITGPLFRGGLTNFQVTQIVRNVSDQTLFVRARPRSAPGMRFLRAEVIPGPQAGVGRTVGAPLRTWEMAPGASAFLSYFYRLGDDTDAVCVSPPVDRLRAPVDVTDAAGRLARVSEEETQAPATSRSWVGGWLIDMTASCARTVRRGPAAPFLALPTPADATRQGQTLQYRLVTYGVPGESATTLSGLRMVGAYAHLPVSVAPAPGQLAAGQRRELMVSIAIGCPEPGVPIVLALSYRSGSDTAPDLAPLVLVELEAPLANVGARC